MSIGLFTSLNYGRYLLLLQLITVLCIVNFKLVMETAFSDSQGNAFRSAGWGQSGCQLFGGNLKQKEGSILISISVSRV